MAVMVHASNGATPRQLHTAHSPPEVHKRNVSQIPMFEFQEALLLSDVLSDSAPCNL